MSRAGAQLLAVLSLWGLLVGLPSPAADRESTVEHPPAATITASSNRPAPATIPPRSRPATKARLMAGAGLIALCILLLAVGLALLSAFRK